MTGHPGAPRVPVRRKIAVATWRPSRDGRIYARMEVDVTAALAYIDRVREETGERITITHVVGQLSAGPCVRCPRCGRGWSSERLTSTGEV